LTIGVRPAAEALPISRAAAGEIAAAAVAFAAVGGLAADHGGFFPTTWGWASVALCAITAIALAVFGAPVFSSTEKVVLGATVALSLWTFASSIWSISVTRSMLEGERSLVYVSGILVALLISRRAGGRAVVTGTWLAITAVCTYSLVTRLFPEQFGVVDPLAGNRLSSPIGYWNALGLFAAVGCLLAVGLAARGSTVLRTAAAASTVVLVLTLYFTFGRGAWIALFAGLVATFAADRNRLQLGLTVLVVAPFPAVAVYSATRATALTRVDATLHAAQKDGHGAAVIAVFVMTAAALATLALDALESRRKLELQARAGKTVAAVLVAVVVAAAAALAIARYGSPARIAVHGWHAFTTSPAGTGSNLNNRLFHLSGSGRIDHWRVAAKEVAAHPWLGSGAGTFGEYWFHLRPSTTLVHDAHNVYLEMLAELGPVGLALLVVLLGALIVGAARSRSPLAAAAVGACVTYAVHSAAEWDWELPVLLLAVAFPALAVAEGPALESAQPLERRPRLVPAAAVVAAGGFALFGLLGNVALSRSGSASDATHWRQAASEARSALGLVPWSAEPLRKLAVAEGGLGQIDAARRSLLDAVGLEPSDWSLWYQLSEVSAGAAHRRALVRARRLNPRRTKDEAVPGDLRLVVAP